MNSRNSLVERPDELDERSRIPSGRRRQISGPRTRTGKGALRLWVLGLALVVETTLLLLALIPQNVWADAGLPAGPIPLPLAPLVAALFYVLPALTGLLVRRWQVAVVLATFPAWLDLGLFAVGAATRIGPFYLALEPHAISTVGTLELFAVLGALGWLARPLLFALGAALPTVMKVARARGEDWDDEETKRQKQ